MDSFDLHWPNATATLYTDGAHLKIVVRDKRGPSGTINNIELCKKRVAFGIEFAPNLLAELKASGYGGLADDIGQLTQASQVVPDPDPVDRWLAAIRGDDSWQDCGARRSSTWHAMGGNYLLKIPTPRGKPEWVLKELRDEGKPAYVSAVELKGILCVLCERQRGLAPELAAALAEIAHEHAEIDAAVRAWPKH